MTRFNRTPVLISSSNQRWSDQRINRSTALDHIFWSEHTIYSYHTLQQMGVRPSRLWYGYASRNNRRVLLAGLDGAGKTGLTTSRIWAIPIDDPTIIAFLNYIPCIFASSCSIAQRSDPRRDSDVSAHLHHTRREC